MLTAALLLIAALVVAECWFAIRSLDRKPFKPQVHIADKPRERLLGSPQIVRHLSDQAKRKQS